MRRSLITGLLLLGAVAAPGTAIGQQLQWATSAGGTQIDAAQSVGVDAAGNSYVVGTFAVAATFGAGQANETVLTSAGAITSQDVFVAKYDPAGSLVWARGIGATDPPSGGYAGTDFGWDIAVDAAGNSYVTGAFASGTSFVDFGNGVTTGGQGPFAARYDAEGNAVWATSLGQSGHGVSIDVDASGNSYVAGFAPLPVIGGETVTVWKLTPAGTPAWVRQASFNGVGSARALGISVDDSGASRVTGRIQAGSFVFGSGELAETTLVDANTSGEVFIASYDTQGTLIWARQSVSTTGAWGQGIASDEDGTSYVTGFFHGTTTFGAGTNATALVAVTPTLSDLFIAKYDSLGDLVWARPVHATGNAGGTDVAVTSTGLYVTGWFGGLVTFAPGEANEVTIAASADGLDLLVARYGPAGSLVWARADGGDTGPSPAFDQGNGIAVGEEGHVLVAGEFPDTATLGSGDPNQTLLVSTGQADMFLARYVDRTVAGPTLDLDISQFRTSKRASVSRGQSIDISLVVENGSTVTGSAGAIVVGVQAGVEVYSQTSVVTDAPGNGRTRFDFPGFTPTVSGEIAWTVTIADADADPDTASTTTVVVP